MMKRLCKLTLVLSLMTSSLSFAEHCDAFLGCIENFADCVGSFELGVGWRRDQIKWNLHQFESSRLDINSHARRHFKDLNFYTAQAKVQLISNCYYIRLSADYGLSDKGRLHNHVELETPLLKRLGGDVDLFFNKHVKRRSEVYDFSGAVGYPLTFCCNTIDVIPLIGFSFHRQRLRVESFEFESFFSLFDSSGSSDDSLRDRHRRDHHGGRDHVDPVDIDLCDSSSFSSESGDCHLHLEGRDAEIARLLKSRRHGEGYRFTWYSPYIGADIFWALDPYWTLFAQLEGHFYGSCHRKQNFEGILFRDEYHSTGMALGFNGKVGAIVCVDDCWFYNITVDFRAWNSNCRNFDDRMQWRSAGVNVGVGYIF